MLSQTVLFCTLFILKATLHIQKGYNLLLWYSLAVQEYLAQEKELHIKKWETKSGSGKLCGYQRH